MAQVTKSVAPGSKTPRYFDQVLKLAERMDSGMLDIVLPDGQRVSLKGEKPGPSVELTVHNPELFARIIRQGVLGFAEGYLDGDWSTDNLQGLLDNLYSEIDAFYEQAPGAGLVRAYERFRFWLQSNSKRQAKKNISYHYDLGNDFYSLWLDDTMTYSAAIFETGQESLEQAQTAKYKSMVDQMGVKPGDHVLEIGCGWGGFAEYAAKERGLRVTGLTISQEQHDYAVKRIADAGLSDMVEIRMQDYREETGTYDGIASIEMFEAVGEKYWPVYFETVKKCLKPGAQATLQVITMDDARFESYRKTVDFIQKYIFPGGMLPSPGILRSQATAQGLKVVKSIEFADGYSQTLRRWHEVFNDHWGQISKMGFDDRFRRMWNFYLTSCAASFRTRNSDVTQITIARPA